MNSSIPQNPIQAMESQLINLAGAREVKNAENRLAALSAVESFLKNRGLVTAHDFIDLQKLMGRVENAPNTPPVEFDQVMAVFSKISNLLKSIDKK